MKPPRPFVWFGWRYDCPNLQSHCDAWTFATHTDSICIHGPSVALPQGYQVQGGRKYYATLIEAQRAALKTLQASLRKTQRTIAADLREMSQ